MHDFAWTTSPAFVERRERFESPGLPAVDIRLLLQAEHAEQAQRHLDATRAALKYYGLWFGPYPYGQITVVDPVTIFNARAQGESTGGMEYPTLFTAGTRWYAPWLGSQPESVTVHEAGHQFWYGLVATNEFEHAWMDEGLNTYSTERAMAEAWPGRFVTVERYFGGMIPWSYADVRWSRDVDGSRLNTFRPVAGYDAQSTPSWQVLAGVGEPDQLFEDGAVARDTGKTDRVADDTANPDDVLPAGAFRHPTPEEFFAIANEIRGQDLTWFFDAVHRSAARFDYAVSQVTVRRAIRRSSFAGWRTASSRRRSACASTMASRRTESWDGREPWRSFHYTRPARIASVQVDPEHVLLLDLNYTNNSWTARPRAETASKKWALRWLTWFEDLLLTYAFFA